MFKNYFKTAFRNFKKNKIFSFINIVGLSIGISAALVIYMIIQYEFSYEKFQKDGKQVYRVVTNMHFPNMDFKSSGVPGPLTTAAINEIPGIEKSTAFWQGSAMNVEVPGQNNVEPKFRKRDHIILADENYFRFLNYEWLAGSPDRALDGINKVVLTESSARTYFPYADITQAMGKTLVYDDSINVTVTGIVKDLDEITDFTFKEFISLPTFLDQLKRNNGWDQWGSVSSSSQFFIRLANGTDTANINSQLAEIRKKHEKDAYLKSDFFLQALNDIHFNSEYDAFDQRQAHKPTLYGLLAVAAFLLLLGCINFINLTTAQATQRAKEIGIRKTMGSSKRNLVFQFLSETFWLTLFATIISVLITPWILNLFSAFIPDGLNFSSITQPNIIVFLFLLTLVVTFFSGFYPALVLSGYKPIFVLKNQAYASSSQTRRLWVRKTLTVSQFVIAQFFIIATLVVGKQIRYSVNRDMGFKKEAIINFSVPFDYSNPDTKQYVLQQKLKALPGIQNMSLAGPPPANNGISVTTMKALNKNGEEVETSVEIKQADPDYFNLYNIKFLAGHNLQQSDTVREYVINENYARFLGYDDPKEIIGHTIDPTYRNIPIVGVIKDINTKSLHNPITPLAFNCYGKMHTTFHIALATAGSNTDSWKNTIASIDEKWKEVYPDEEFNYTFFDESIEKFYKKEQQTASLLNWCTGLTVFISCLGLLGLVIYTTNQRTKEIGVRKVLGASVIQIVSLLSKDFVRLALVAFLIAAPVAWWAMNKWLEDFVFRTNISWWVFAGAGIAGLFVALLTVSFQAIKAAVANPVESLKNE